MTSVGQVLGHVSQSSQAELHEVWQPHDYLVAPPHSSFLDSACMPDQQHLPSYRKSSKVTTATFKEVKKCRKHHCKQKFSSLATQNVKNVHKIYLILNAAVTVGLICIT